MRGFERLIDKGTYALGRSLSRAGAAIVRQIERHPHATVACAAAVVPPLVGAACGPIAGRVAGVVAEAVVVATAIHAVHEVAAKHGVALDLGLLAGIAEHEELRSALPALGGPKSLVLTGAREIAAHPVRTALSMVPPIGIALHAIDAARAADRAFRIVSVARAEADRLARAA